MAGNFTNHSAGWSTSQSSSTVTFPRLSRCQNSLSPRDTNRGSAQDRVAGLRAALAWREGGPFGGPSTSWPVAFCRLGAGARRGQAPARPGRSRLAACTTKTCWMLTALNPREIASRTTCSRCPSASTASTNGWDRSSRRPPSQHPLHQLLDLGGSGCLEVSSCRPERATKTRFGSLIQN